MESRAPLGRTLAALASVLMVWLTGGADWLADTIIMARNSENAPKIRGAEPRPVQPVLGCRIKG
jgi:hypothetical protein